MSGDLVQHLPKLASCVAGTTGECNDTSAFVTTGFAVIAFGVVAVAIVVLVVWLLTRHRRR